MTTLIKIMHYTANNVDLSNDLYADLFMLLCKFETERICKPVTGSGMNFVWGNNCVLGGLQPQAYACVWMAAYRVVHRGHTLQS